LLYYSLHLTTLLPPAALYPKLTLHSALHCCSVIREKCTGDREQQDTTVNETGFARYEQLFRKKRGTYDEFFFSEVGPENEPPHTGQEPIRRETDVTEEIQRYGKVL